MKKKFFIILPILIAVFVFVGLFIYYNAADKETSLTVMEKRWLEDHEDIVVDLEILNNFPLYGMNGSGVLFQFLEDFEKNVGLEFNKIPYLKESTPTSSGYRVRILNNEESLSNKDLLIAEDGYVMIGKTYQRINKISDLKDVTFGVFTDDVGELSYYLKSGNDLSYKTYDGIQSLYTALDKGEVGMIIVPNLMYLDKYIGQSGYSINYYFTEMSKKIVLTLSEEDSKLNNIIKKYYTNWKSKYYVKEYNDAYLDYYILKNSINDKTRADLISKNYVYGYVENAPYDVTDGKVSSGIASEYLHRMERLTNIDFTYKRYKTVQDLKKAVNRGEVDVYFDYYNMPSENYLTTLSTFVEDYVVLGRVKDNHIISSFESLKGQQVAMIGDNALYDYFANNSRTTITTFRDVSELVKKSKDKLVIVDRETYNHYRTSKFSKYEVLYIDTMMNDYKFMVKKENQTFYDLFNYIINTNSYYRYRNSGIESLNRSLLEKTSFQQLYLIILGIILVPMIAIAVLYFGWKRKKKIKEVRKEDRRKYTDMLTSLKNRNYLNLNMNKWESCNVFPQAIVIVDLNNVKYVNDNYGHEAGDDLIVKAASILVNTQLENSEIIRTDGNEFLIYLMGYSEQQMITYTNKLTKELKELPHEFGAAVGFSMIKDEIKTIDDAINEATLDMRTHKEDYK